MCAAPLQSLKPVSLSLFCFDTLLLRFTLQSYEDRDSQERSSPKRARCEVERTGSFQVLRCSFAFLGCKP